MLMLILNKSIQKQHHQNHTPFLFTLNLMGAIDCNGEAMTVLLMARTYISHVRQFFMMPKKASTPVDWAIGAVLFVFLVAVTFYYASYLMGSKQPYETVLRNAGTDVAEKIESNVTWTIKRLPVAVFSGGSIDRQVQVYFRLPDEAYESTLFVVDSAGNPVARIFEDDTILWSAELPDAKTIYNIYYSEDINLTEYAYDTDVSVLNTTINNSAISTNFSATGQVSMIFDGMEFFDGSGMEIETLAAPLITNNTVYAEVNYSSGVSLKIYSRIQKVEVYSDHLINVTISLSTDFTEFYAGGSVYSFPAGSYNGITDFVDVYNTSGLAVIGDSINFSVSGAGLYREIKLYNVSAFEIYAHNGNYTNAVAEKNAYFSSLSYVIGIPEDIKGVSAQLFSDMASVSQSALKESMGLSGISFQVLFNETENYASIPRDRSVLVVKHPISVLNRFGVAETSYLGVAIWS